MGSEFRLPIGTDVKHSFATVVDLVGQMPAGSCRTRWWLE
jgi:hypothetical protein